MVNQAKLNKFHLLSVFFMLLLIVYLWLRYLPAFENTMHYQFVRNVIIILTIALLLAASLMLLQAKVSGED